MYKTIQERCEALAANFGEIPGDRKELLEKLAAYIIQRLREDKPAQLVYICTHNSRRSHLGQIWALVAASYYGIENVLTFSGGTEVTAFNANAIKALETSGFIIQRKLDSSNPEYKVYYSEDDCTTSFSKIFDNEINPKTGFAAVMTCSDAEENCPFIPGCDLRIGTAYYDPKAFDNTVLQDDKYMERSNQIALECLYVFSKVLEK